MRPSLSMRTKAFGAKVALAAMPPPASAAAAARASGARRKPSTSALPAAAAVRISSRRDTLPLISRPLRRGLAARRLLDRGADAHVGAAAADVAGHGGIDLRIVRLA